MHCDNIRQRGSAYAVIIVTLHLALSVCAGCAAVSSIGVEAPDYGSAKITRAEVSPDGTMWFTMMCRCPSVECQEAMRADCKGRFEIDGWDNSRPLPEWSKLSQRRGYELRYKCLHEESDES